MRKYISLILCLLFASAAHAQVKISALPTYPQAITGTESIPASNTALSATQSYQVSPAQLLTYTQNNFYPRTAAEIAAGVTPVNYGYPAGNALRYGCVGNNSTLNDTCVTNAIAAAIATGGTGFVYFPAGTYRVANQVVWKNNMLVYGDGDTVSTILSTYTSGDQNVILNPINSSTAANVEFRDLQFESASTNAGEADFADTGSTFLYFYRVSFNGDGINLTLDQSELVRVINCLFQNVESGSVGVWIVNGAEHTAGAAAGYTNELLFQGNQFNGPQTTGTLLVADDGGASHKFISNNFNYGATEIRANQVRGLLVLGNEMELPLSSIVDFETTKYGGNAGGASYSADIAANSFATGATAPEISVTSASLDYLTAIDNTSSSSGGATINNSGVVDNYTVIDNDVSGGPAWPSTKTYTVQNGGAYQALDASGNHQSLLDITSSNNVQLANTATTGAGQNVQVTVVNPNGDIEFLTNSGQLRGTINPSGNWSISAPASGTALSVDGVSGQLALSAAQPVGLPSFTVSTLPACNSTLKGGMAYVTDATTPTYNGALTGGGSVVVPVFCNGSGWTAH